VFDDGCAIPEKTLVHVGDDVVLNAGSTVQAHSLEDGAFKSDHIVIGPRVTVGPRGFVHYGVTLHEGAVLDADAFLMKGQEVPAYTRWRGNPAAETRDPHVAAPESRSPAALVATVALAALILAALPAGVALALAPRPPTSASPTAAVVADPAEAAVDDAEGVADEAVDDVEMSTEPETEGAVATDAGADALTETDAPTGATPTDPTDEERVETAEPDPADEAGDASADASEPAP
jgi:carbonic anhydrase/acetyltransferase-like protein (isoleucine patch superfamily)